MKAVPEAQEHRQSFVDRSDLFPCKLPEHSPDPPLIDRPQMVDQREGFRCELR
jgi:hypothetical protein